MNDLSQPQPRETTAHTRMRLGKLAGRLQEWRANSPEPPDSPAGRRRARDLSEFAAAPWDVHCHSYRLVSSKLTRVGDSKLNAISKRYADGADRTHLLT